MGSKTAGEGVAMAPMSTTTFQVSVLYCKKTGRVLFLEAGKDFVDTLLSFLLLPVGTIIHMLSTEPVQVKPLGGISGIFHSVKNLDCSNLLQVDKKNLVEPKSAAVGTCSSTGLLQGLEAAKTPSPPKKRIELPTVYYRCNSNNCISVSTKQGARCEPCGQRYSYDNHTYSTVMYVLPRDLESLRADIERVANPVEEASSSTSKGFVRENIIYMVTDSLEIMPSTTIRSIKALNKLKVATLADLESNDITVSITQVLQLLRSAMTSSSCLNEVFGTK